MEKKLDELHYVIIGLFHIFISLPLIKIITIMSWFIAYSCGFISLFIFPLIYKLWIVPNIEKRLNQHFVYPKNLGKFYLGQYYFQYILIARYICACYISQKFKCFKSIKTYGFIEQMGYTINSASPIEIFVSLLVYINLYTCLASALIGTFLIGYEWLVMIIILFIIITWAKKCFNSYCR